MGKKRNLNKDKRLFHETINDIRKLVSQHNGDYTADVMGCNKQNTKYPYKHLMGRRNKMHDRFKDEKNRGKNESIQYDSSMQILNSKIMQQFKQNKKDSFMKNQYKYQGITNGKIGRQKQGLLQLSKKDIDRIQQKTQKNNKPEIFKRKRYKNKIKKHKKNKSRKNKSSIF